MFVWWYLVLLETLEGLLEFCELAPLHEMLQERCIQFGPKLLSRCTLCHEHLKRPLAVLTSQQLANICLDLSVLIVMRSFLIILQSFIIVILQFFPLVLLHLFFFVLHSAILVAWQKHVIVSILVGIVSVDVVNVSSNIASVSVCRRDVIALLVA